MTDPKSRDVLARIAVGAIVVLCTWFAFAAGRDLYQGKTRDFHEFFSAAEAIVRHQDIYKAGSLGYIYPPLLAFLLTPLVSLGEIGAASVWLGFNIVLLVVTLVVAAKDSQKRLGAKDKSLVMIGAAIGLALIADKVRADLAMGQSNILIACCWMLALATIERRPTIAATVLGMAANIKYVTLIAVPYLVIRRRYKAAALTCAMTMIWAMFPAMTLGISQNNAYLKNAFGGLARMTASADEIADSKAGAGETSDGKARIAALADIRSISIPSFASRVSKGSLTAPGTLAIAGTAAVLFCGIAWWMYWRAGTGLIIQSESEQTPMLLAAEWSGLLVAVLAFGPQTNPRHLVMLLPMLVLLAMMIILRTSRGERIMLPTIGVGLLFAALVLPPGGETFERAVNDWRTVSGISWCLLVCYLTFLATTLKTKQAALT